VATRPKTSIDGKETEKRKEKEEKENDHEKKVVEDTKSLNWNEGSQSLPGLLGPQ
jgi:hypothetical protein